MASASKDGKEAKESKEPKDGSKKSKDEGSGGSLQKRILQELTALRADVDALKAAPLAQEPSDNNAKNKLQPRESATKKRGEDDGGASFLQGLRDAVDGSGKGKNTRAAYVAVAHAYRREGDDGIVDGSSDLCVHGGLNGILEVSDTQTARFGQAFSAPQKIALLRVLIADGSQSSAQLEEKANLTTGSLYHHLRELIHAHVVESAGRSFYRLTELGLQSALVVFVQAARISEK